MNSSRRVSQSSKTMTGRMTCRKKHRRKRCRRKTDTPQAQEQSGRLPGNLLSESGTDRQATLVREPCDTREADAHRNGDKRAQGNGKQLRGKYSAAPLRAVPRRDKHPVREQLSKACLTMVIYCILTGLLVYYIALWLWYHRADSWRAKEETTDRTVPENQAENYTLIGKSRYKGGLIGTPQDKSGHLPQAAENDTILRRKLPDNRTKRPAMGMTNRTTRTRKSPGTWRATTRVGLRA